MDRRRKASSNFSTDELLALIQSASSLASFYEDAGESLSGARTHTYLNELLAEHSLTKQAVIEAADLERSTGYLIFAGQRNPKRDTLLRIALAMKLTLAETQRLLKIAQRGELYPKNHRDAALLYCIHHQLGLIETEMLLDGIGEPLLT